MIFPYFPLVSYLLCICWIFTQGPHSFLAAPSSSSTSFFLLLPVCLFLMLPWIFQVSSRSRCCHVFFCIYHTLLPPSPSRPRLLLMQLLDSVLFFSFAVASSWYSSLLPPQILFLSSLLVPEWFVLVATLFFPPTQYYLLVVPFPHSASFH